MVWGQGGNFLTAGCNIDAVFPDAATLCGPYGVTADATGNVYISDSGNSRITAYAPPFPPPGLQIPATSDGVLYLQPAQVSFNPTVVGKRRVREVKLTNGGSAPVRIRSISTGGDFSYTSNCGPVLPTNDTCIMQVTFSPLTRGDRGGAIVISDDARKSPHLIRLSGHGKKGPASR